MTARRRGFTLLETAIVLAITAIGALLVLPMWPAALTRGVQRDDSPGAALATELTEARRHAIASRHAVTVHIDVTHGRLRMDTTGAGGRGVWRDTVLPLAPDEALTTADTAAVWLFRPTGAAQGQPMALRHAAGWVTVSVDPWSGEVRRVAR